MTRIPPTPRSWLLKSCPDKSRLYGLVLRGNKGERFLFVLIKPECEEKFLTALHGTQPFDLTAYGNIIERGAGIPDAAFIEAMCHKFDAVAT